MRLPRIAFTMGDPAGIGPEIILRMLEAHPEFARQAELLIYGISEVIENARQRFCRKELPAFTMVQATDVEVEHFADGVLDPAGGLAAYQTVAAAAGDALDGKIDAMVTAPVNKAAVNLNGIHFTGHTELAAEICAARDFAMMQSAGDLRIAFVTTHITLAKVPAACTFERIVRVGPLLRDAVAAEGIASPRIGVAAINPHAGENGYMGMEDKNVVKPAVRRMNELGIHAAGPIPPDTLFIKSMLEQRNYFHVPRSGAYPVQNTGVQLRREFNFGTSHHRTSVDHGTAFNIAGKGIADFNSLAEAFRIACRRAVSKINRGNFKIKKLRLPEKSQLKIHITPTKKRSNMNNQLRHYISIEPDFFQMKDNYGANHVRVKGHLKVLCHLMFGVLVLTVKQIFNYFA